MTRREPLDDTEDRQGLDPEHSEADRDEHVDHQEQHSASFASHLGGPAGYDST
jgi:hypothetical protein